MKKEQLDMKKRIIPHANEVSFAFNPCNKRRFIMMKEKEMDELLKLLQESEPLLKEEKIIALLAKDKTSADAEMAAKGAIRILYAFKDKLPKGFFSRLAKEVPEYADFVEPMKAGCTKEEVEKLRKEIEAETRKTLEKEYEEKMKKDGAGDAELKMLKDQIEELKKDNAESKKGLQEEKDKRRDLELRKELTESGFVGDMDKTVKIAAHLEKTDPEMFKDFMEQQKAVGALIGADLEVELGSGSVGPLAKDKYPGSSEYSKLEQMVKDYIKDHPEVTPAKAWRAVINANQAMYKEYRKKLK